MRTWRFQREVELVVGSEMKGLDRWRRPILSLKKTEAIEEGAFVDRKKDKGCLTQQANSG